MIRRLLCLSSAHRWVPAWDYVAGVIHVSAVCDRCAASTVDAVDMVRAGFPPTDGVGVVWDSPVGRIGPILWDDQSTWSSGDEEPRALLVHQIY